MPQSSRTNLDHSDYFHVFPLGSSRSVRLSVLDHLYKQRCRFRMSKAACQALPLLLPLFLCIKYSLAETLQEERASVVNGWHLKACLVDFQMTLKDISMVACLQVELPLQTRLHQGPEQQASFHNSEMWTCMIDHAHPGIPRDEQSSICLICVQSTPFKCLD